MGKIKRILDSVHGYIDIDDSYFSNIIDTDYFQRLRRIEQTSTRALFPSARHDRFIHSLGVFHIGCKIVERLSHCPNLEHVSFDLSPIFESYKIACLLHDVCHSPFSHTFEKYFDNKKSDLKALLKRIVASKSFSEDWESVLDPSAPHERMSAIVAVMKFGKFIKETAKADCELVARMIIGLHYRDNSDEACFRNAMIELIHGDVIDADGLDYVCRDAWASGYSTNKIDITRLVASICIEKNDKGKYTLCFTTKSLNEIESVLKVKTFQQFYVINHHTVTYEQKLLVEAVKSTALKLIGCDEELSSKDIVERKENAIRNLCSIYAFVQPEPGIPIGVKTKDGILISMPMDDDFVFLMKMNKEDNYVKQWLSRNYALKPLWKSKAEFYSLFPNLVEVKLTANSWIFHDDCKRYIANNFNLPIEDIWIERATPKYKGNFAKKVNLFVGGKVISYEKLFPKDIQSYEPPENEFFYIFVPQNSDKEEILKSLKEECSKMFFERRNG